MASYMQITRLPVTIKMPPELGYLHRQLERIYTDIFLAFIPYNTCFFITAKSFLRS